MSSIKTTHIDGDTTISRNLHMGGRSVQQGNSHIKGNLKVDGWLDATNIKNVSKGLFQTIEKLRESYPAPLNGWWALVGSSLPAPLYVAYNGVWTATGGFGGDATIDVDYYNESIEHMQDIINEQRRFSYFNGFVEECRLQESSVIETIYGEVIYVLSMERFVYKLDENYYAYWTSSQMYNGEDGHPRQDRIFASDMLYIWNGEELKPIHEDNIEIVQDTGSSTTAVMSQKAVSDAISNIKIFEFHGYIDNAVFTGVGQESVASFDGKVYFIKNAGFGENARDSRRPIFAYLYNGVYYTSASYIGDYVYIDDNGDHRIIPNKIFRYNGTDYVFNGAELLPLSEINKITTFDGIVDTATISDNMPYANGQVIFVKDARCFVNYYDGIYYRYWSARDVYMDSITGLPITNSFFAYNNQQYIFNGTELILVGGGDDIDLSDYMKKNGSNYEGDKPLVTPVITSQWTITNVTPQITKNDLNISVENGAKLTYKGSFKWSVEDDLNKSPVSCLGSFGTALPDNGVSSDYLEVENITKSVTFAVALNAPKVGLEVNNNKVIRANGNDKTQASTSVSFYNRRYWGVSPDTNADITLLNSELSNSRAKTITFDCSGGKYFYYAYPKSLGLSSWNIGGLSFTGYTLQEKTIVNEYGLRIVYYVYRSTDKQTGNNIKAIIT